MVNKRMQKSMDINNLQKTLETINPPIRPDESAEPDSLNKHPLL